MSHQEDQQRARDGYAKAAEAEEQGKKDAAKVHELLADYWASKPQGIFDD